MIPKRKPIPGNRKARRAEGVKLVKIKRGGGGNSGTSLADALKNIIAAHDSSVAMSPGLLEGERGWLFHRRGEFTYAVTATASRVTLHVVALHGERHALYKKRIANGVFGKGLVRFKSDAHVDMSVVGELVRECAADG